ncbi:MAG: signal peptidase I [Spirochaeta sp. LUC14_002_19_P3]|nr:MAG: signal peptidase I [Spirochaeta sp. LUC14_002_19_P3]
MSRSRLSYKDKLSYQRQRIRTLGALALVLLFYFLLTSMLISSWMLRTAAMEPSFPEGTRILVKPYLLRDSEGHLKNPPKRGDVVAVYPPYIPKTPRILTLVNPIVRLFTFQRVSLGGHLRREWENERIFKRIIGIPGDTVRFEGSAAYVRAPSDSDFVSEFSKSGIVYDLEYMSLPSGWSADLPLAGSQTMELGPNEYCVLGDNRSISNDSRSWGPISDTAIRGRVVFIYWPTKAFGKPGSPGFELPAFLRRIKPIR